MALLHTRLVFLAFQAGVAVTQRPPNPARCSARPGCVAAGLTGDNRCCPTDDGIQLACCDEPSPSPPTSDPSPSSTCAANPGCVALGRRRWWDNNCCPTSDGIQLACCDDPSPSPPTPDPSPSSTCASNPGCVAVGLTGDNNCCPTDDGMQLACCHAPLPSLPNPPPHPVPLPSPPVPDQPPHPGPDSTISLFESVDNQTCLDLTLDYPKETADLAVSPCRHSNTTWRIYDGLLMDARPTDSGNKYCAYPADDGAPLQIVSLARCPTHKIPIPHTRWSFNQSNGELSVQIGDEQRCLEYSSDWSDTRVRATLCHNSTAQKWRAFLPALVVV